MSPVEILLVVLAAHLALGALFALPFLVRGLETIDHAAKGSSWAFRLLILPGVATLWPLLLLKWRRVRRSHPSHRP